MKSLKGLLGYSSISFCSCVRIQARICSLEPMVSISLGIICLQDQLHSNGAGLHLGLPLASDTFVPVYVYRFPKDYNDINIRDSTIS